MMSEEPVPGWTLSYDRFDPDQEKRREALCTLGNGYFATRGAAPEATADDVHYPGTYLAGVYNRVETVVDGYLTEYETLVNAPNWLSLSFRIEDAEWIDLRGMAILSYRQELHLQHGMLSRAVRFEDAQGRRTRLTERRFVHMGCPHLAGLETVILAENWAGRIDIRSAIDGTVANKLVENQPGAETRHVVPIDGEALSNDVVWLKVRTSQSRIEIDVAARTRMEAEGNRHQPECHEITHPDYIGHVRSAELAEGATLVVDKVAAIYTSCDPAISEGGLAARQAVMEAPNFADLLASHITHWGHLWRRCGLSLADGHVETECILRLHIFHVLQTASPNTRSRDVAAPSRGWTGEAYHGHIFWDELFVLAYLNRHFPDVSRSLLLYRYRRLDAARRDARRWGYKGAMFPWQSGSDGREETPPAYANPRTGGWIRDDTRLERHIDGAVAYNVWQYYEVTGDLDFLNDYGAEILIDIARFWSSIATYNEELARYEIHGVMGPDEFHTGYPGAETPGLSNNTYTNVLAVWSLCRALDALNRLPTWRREELSEQLNLHPDEIQRWEDVSRRMRIVSFGDGILAQFEGYERLEELDWDAYRERYGDIERLDYILDAEGDTPNRYKLSKQPDVLMLFYLFSNEELSELFERLGYAFDREMMRRNIDYYLQRSSRGSTLSRVVYAWIVARIDLSRSWTWFNEALRSDVDDIQGGTTPDGVHLGAMSGTVDLMERCYGGIEARGDTLRFDPHLPDELPRLSMRLLYRRCWLDITVTRDRLCIHAAEDAPAEVKIRVGQRVERLIPGGRIDTSW
ncbi:MAG TPA: glycosyl hydrolase family 65 protein [Thermomicrobiales bacterium]|nr:glycosyl hydrolase family 65 protein [Thermomicrobiales bacterium]